MVDTAHVKLVTIIASSALRDSLELELQRLGVTGYTVSAVEGRGKHGIHRHGVFQIANLRIESIVSSQVAEAILAYIARHAATHEWFEAIGFSHDIEAVPSGHFV
jgi:nitrogen regulatory protein PII